MAEPLGRRKGRSATANEPPPTVTRVVAYGTLWDAEGEKFPGELATVPATDAERFEASGVLVTEEAWKQLQAIQEAQAKLEALKTEKSAAAPSPGRTPVAPTTSASAHGSGSKESALPPELAKYQEGAKSGEKKRHE